jgi:tetratricopeptide (TPR) repeat protein
MVLSLFFTLLFIMSDSTLAQSFPFRGLKIGAPVPDAEFVAYQGGETVNIHSLAGKPLLLVFWGGDMASKKKRSVLSLKAVEGLLPYLKKNEVSVLVVDMQSDTKEMVDDVVSLSGLTLPVYSDASRTVYGKYGLYILPSFLMVDADGKVSCGLGYSKDIAQRLRGTVDVLLGIKTAAELAKELNPEMKEVPENILSAMRRMNMGVVLENKGMPEGAIEEYLAALELNPDLYQARVKLGCLYMEGDALDNAVKELEGGLEGDSKSLEAEICLARVSAKMGEVDEALEDLNMLLFRNSREPILHYTIGLMLEKKKKYEDAAKAYRKGYELLEREETLQKQ